LKCLKETSCPEWGEGKKEKKMTQGRPECGDEKWIPDERPGGGEHSRIVF